VATFLVSGARAPVALEWLRIFSRAGHKVFVADTHKTLADYSHLEHEGFVHASPRFSFDEFKNQAIQFLETRPVDRIVATCEEIFYWALALKDTRFKNALWAPDFETLLKLHSKKHFLELVKSAGLAVPESKSFANLDSLLSSVSIQELPSLVVKAEYSRFAASAAIRPKSKDELLKRFRSLPEQPWLAQRAITGTELCSYAIFDKGKVLAQVSYPSQITFGAGSNVFFEAIQNPLIGPWLDRFARSMPNVSGQLAFDFFVEGNRLLPIECNPRSTSGLHLMTSSHEFCSQISSIVLGQASEALNMSGLLSKSLALPLWLLGPRCATRKQFGLWVRAVRESNDVVFDGRDWGALWGQCVQSIGLVANAIKSGRSIAASTTHDIEFGFEQIKSLK
jgi:hypothetical protein